jgi:integration host factor subunit beta
VPRNRAVPVSAWPHCGNNDFRNSLVKSMTKSELIEILSARHSQLAPKDAELAVKTMLDAMSQTLAQGDRIEIRGFGSFGLNYRPPRTGRNPKTGEKVQVPKKYVPHFKAGKELRERVDLIDDAANAAAVAGTVMAAHGE